MSWWRLVVVVSVGEAEQATGQSNQASAILGKFVLVQCLFCLTPVLVPPVPLLLPLLLLLLLLRVPSSTG
jgi:hypothetical protein